MSESGEKKDAVAVRSTASGLVLRTMEEHKAFGLALYTAGLVEGDKNEACAKAVVAIQCGAELGIGPMSAVRGIFVMDGKPVMSAGLMGALIKGSDRYDYRVIEHTDQVCSIDFFDRDHPAGSSSFTMDDAQLAGVAFKTRKGYATNWTKFPRNMLFARALSNGAKWYCPDLFCGAIYTPDEIVPGAIDAAFDVEPDPSPESPAPAQPDDGGFEMGSTPAPQPAPGPQQAKPETTLKRTLNRLRDLLKIAQGYPDNQQRKKLIADLQGAGVRYKDGEISAKGAGVVIGHAKKALETLGWKEPQEWIDDRKKRAAEKRAAKKDEAAKADEPDPQIIADAKADKVDADKRSGVWATAAHMRNQLADAGLVCEQLGDLWDAADNRSIADIVAATAAGAGVLAQYKGAGQGEMPLSPGPTTLIRGGDLAAVLLELEDLRLSHKASDGIRSAIDSALSCADRGTLHIDEAIKLRDEVLEFCMRDGEPMEDF